MTLTQLLQHAITQGASDLHLSSGWPPALRVDGELHPLDAPPLSDALIRSLIEGIIPEHLHPQHAAGDEIDFAFEMPALARVRGNVFRQARGLSAALRILPATLPDLAALNAPPILRELSERPHGLILVTGPTGSGKSTTLAAMLDGINRTRRAHIITIEDPVEFIHTPHHSLIQQRELHRDTQSFQHGLRAALREDPDIIMVGELRDLATIQLALSAAETGHLVLASLHARAATNAVSRIIDAFPAGDKPMVRTMLSQSLGAVIAQVLPKRTGGGRIAAFEIMLATPAIANLIGEDKPAQMYSAIQSGQRYGMQTLDQALQGLLQRGLIAPDEARRYARDQRGFERSDGV